MMTNSVYVNKILVQPDGVAVSFIGLETEQIIMLSADIVVHYELVVSKVIDNDVYIKICKVSSIIDSVISLQKRLARKRLSMYEVEYELMLQCQDKEAVDEALDIFVKQGLLNDAMFVEALCNDAILKRKGFQYCLQVARNKKIDSQLFVPLYDQFMIEQERILSDRIDKLIQLNTTKQEIVNKLVYHGFAQEDILDELSKKEIEFDISEIQFEKANQKFKKHNNLERKQKMINYFLVKGYNKCVIENAFQKYWREK